MNNFEKNIKTKSDSFELQPAPGSFEQVMDALQKRKKRRFIFWLWMLIPGVGVGCGLLLINPFQRSTPFQYLTTGSPSLPWSLKITPGNHPLLGQSTTYFTSPQNKNIHGQDNITQGNRPLQIKQVNGHKKETKSFTQHTSHPTTTVENNTTNSNTVFNGTHSNTTKAHEEKVLDLNVRQPEALIYTNLYTTKYLPYTYIPKMFTTQTLNLPPHHPIRIKTSYSRWSLGAYAEAGVSKNIFVNQKDSMGTYANIRTNTDKFLFSYSAGLQFRYAPVKFLAIETGIGFTHYEANQIISDAGFNAGSATIEDNFLPDTVATIFTTTAVSKEYQNVYDYISIPLKIYYQKKWKWTGVEAGAGVVFDIPVHTSSYAADENTGLSFLRNDVPSSRLNLFGIQASVNVHMVFHANKFSFFAGPVFKYRMNSMFDKNYIVEQRSYFIGAEFGARYNF